MGKKVQNSRLEEILRERFVVGATIEGTPQKEPVKVLYDLANKTKVLYEEQSEFEWGEEKLTRDYLLVLLDLVTKEIFVVKVITAY